MTQNPQPSKDGHGARMSVCVLTNRSFPFKTMLVYADKFYPEIWMSEQQKNGVRLPYPFVLQYELVIWRKDWKTVSENIDRLLAKYETPYEDLGVKKTTAWLKKRHGFVIRKLKRAVGRRRLRQQYFNDAKRWRHMRWGFIAGLLLPLIWFFGRF